LAAFDARRSVFGALNRISAEILARKDELGRLLATTSSD
jgi:hypothetical protein